MSPAENNIISGFKKGDAKAFAYIYDLYYGRLIFFAKRLIEDEQEAEDIVSGVFIKLWQKHTDFDSLPNIKAFLYIAVRNACLDFLRHAKRQAANKKDFLYWSEDREEEILYLMLRTELLHEIATEIEKLPESYRAVCRLSFFEGLPNDQIAERLQLSVKTVRNIKALAVKQIQMVFLRKKLLLFILALSGQLLR
jgi:RNA polymerase sigma-70 factor (ECF subfamily)